MTKATFTLPDDRTHTHRGITYRDGDSADLSDRDRAKLEKRGVIKPRPKPKPKAEEKE